VQVPILDWPRPLELQNVQLATVEKALEAAEGTDFHRNAGVNDCYSYEL
jgi:hypothetical protein